MFGKSRLLLGLLSELDDAIIAQTMLWDRSNVWQASWEYASGTAAVQKATTYVKTRVGATAKKIEDKVSEYIPDWFAIQQTAEPHPLDAAIMKFCRMAEHAQLKLDSALSSAELHDLALAIERAGVKTLQSVGTLTLSMRLQRSITQRLPKRFRTDTPEELDEKFTGDSTDDLVRYVIKRTFEQLDKTFKSKSPDEQEKIASQISTALKELPEEEQNRIRKATGLTDLTATTLLRTGSIAGVGVGLSTLVGVAGFASYTTLTSVVAAVTGMIGIHLSFSTYIMLTSGLAGLTNPLLMLSVFAGGGTFLTLRANNSIRSLLFPTLIATSVMSCEGGDGWENRLEPMIARIQELKAKINTGNDAEVARLVTRFPGLGNPSRVAKLLGRVVS